MNRNKLKTYAPKARRDFIAAVTARATKFGITKNAVEPVQVQGNVAVIAGQAHPKKVAEQRAKLEARIKTRGFEQVMEEAAYTWFNRFAAIRYMEVHGYLDHGYRVLSHPEGKGTPEIVEHAQHLDLPGLDQEKVIELKLDGTKEGELYRMLLVAQCNALHAAMPFLFERIDDETELLLPDNLLHSDSVIRQMVTEIDEADWQEIEIIGWLYQFYISEKKDQVIGKVVKSEDIPAATQLFTPNWIVKYMVQNTLGAKWLATYPQSGIRAKMEYYIEPAEQPEDVKAKLAETTPKELNPEEITFLDPACGSGHILVEAYDLFKEIYLERGYVLRDVPRLILEKNLFGLDIDDRATQMAAFALLMKARADDRRIFQRECWINTLCAGDVDVSIKFEELERVAGSQISSKLLADISHMEGADYKGSLVRMPSGRTLFGEEITDICGSNAGDMFGQTSRNAFINAARLADVLSQQFDCIAANPPYMGMRGMPAALKAFAASTYKKSKYDLFCMFIERGFEFLKTGGHMSMVTMHSWMFLSSFEVFREKVILPNLLLTMAHLGARAFSEISGEVVQTTVFSMQKLHEPNYMPVFIRATLGSERDKIVEIRSGRRLSSVPICEFSKIPGAPIAYWVSDSIRKVFSAETPLSEIAKPRQGLATSDNNRFLRLWHEVSLGNVGFCIRDRAGAIKSQKKWFPCQKGGAAKAWYGNLEYVVNWKDDGKEIMAYAASLYGSPTRTIKNIPFYFRDGITWSTISTSNFAMRYSPHGFIPETKGAMCYFDDSKKMNYVLAFANSPVSTYLLAVLSPTLDFHEGPVGRLPIVFSNESIIGDLAQKAVDITKCSWDDNEISWDFSRHPLLSGPSNSIRNSYVIRASVLAARAVTLAEVQSAIDAHFIETYRLGDCISSNEDAFASEEANARQEILALISYSIACMMGRYCLDAPGLIYAHGGNVGFDPSQYTTFPADDDGIVPIMQTDWFGDDAAYRFVEFVKVAWSPETLAENLKFVADSLGAKAGETPIDTIRRYLSADFFKDHLKTYKKRPIYWLFSSGKEKAFEALVYLHRYNEGTLSRMRMEYVTPLQGRISARIDQLDRDIAAAGSTAQQNKLRKEQEKLKKQQAELIKFDEQLRHYADMRIKLDLDDGVKVNYGKFGTLLAEVKAITGGSDE